MKVRFIFFFFLVFLTLNSCKKDQRFDFPYVPINLYLGLISDLGGLGQDQSVFWPGYGVNGLIIYRTFEDTYFVFDRTCTFESDHSCAVEKDINFSSIMECPCCGSRYLIQIYSEVDVIEGPASYPLVRYRAVVEGDLLHIYN